MNKPLNSLKTSFTSGSKPSQEDFWALIDGIRGFRSLAELEASREIFAEGEIICAGDCRFRVAAPGATDHHLKLASGVKLYDAPWRSYASLMIAPEVSAPGTIGGATRVGAALRVTGAAWRGTAPVLAYQWTRNGADIPGATETAYVPATADIGAQVARRMTVSNGLGAATGATPAVTVGAFSSGVKLSAAEASGVILRANGTDAASQTDALSGVRAERYFSTGKIYFEVAVPGGAAMHAFAYVGLAHAACSLTAGAGATQSPDITYVRLNGGVGAKTGYGNAKAGACDLAGGDAVRVAVDMTARKVWFGTKAGWTGDPATGAGGFPLPDFEFLTVQLNPRSATQANLALRSLRAEFQHAVPAGYAAYGEILAAFESSAAPARADDLVEAIGVNCHLNWRGGLWATSVWKQPLYDLGIRYIRTGIGTSAAAQADLSEVHTVAGIRASVHVAPETDQRASGGANPVYLTSQIDANLASARNGYGVAKVIAFEGPNEPNQGSATAGWQDRSRAAQQYVATAVRGNAVTAPVPVLSPAMWKRSETGATLIGDMGAMADRANIHYYTDGSRPTQGNTEQTTNKSMSWCLEDARGLAKGKPLWVTEYGHRTYDNAAELTAFTPEKGVAAKYMLRGVLEFINRGVERIFLYTLIDDYETSGDAFGLIAKTDTLDFVKRPAYHAVRRLIALFAEPGARFTPAPLRFHLTGNLADIGWRLFQKSNGTYYLAIWQDAQSWNRATLAVTNVPERTVKLGLGREAATIRRHTPTLDASVTTVATGTCELDLAVPDHVAVYEITLS